jgi:predicted outer membrane repeat protein
VFSEKEVTPMGRSLLVVVVISVLTAATASAETWVVLPDSTGDAPTIQAGIDSASAGDTVLVMCGKYYEHDISLKSKVYLTSETGLTDCATIDAQGLGRIFYCNLVHDAAIVGFTAANGVMHVYGGGGMYCRESTIEVTNCTFSDNYADFYGGGVDVYMGSPVFTDCVFSGNTICDSIWAQGGGVHAAKGFPIFIRCDFLDNSAAGASGGGLAYEAWGDSVTLIDCVFERNIAGSGAGAILCYFSSPCSISGCTFRDNDAEMNGGALWVHRSPTAVTGCTFEGNSAYYAGALGIHDSTVTVTDCVFLENTATEFGGGVATESAACEFTRCSFFDNDATYRGGGVSLWWADTSSFNQCVFAGNSVSVGGEPWRGGGGMAVYGSSFAELVRCTFSGNSSAGQGGGIFCGDYGSGSLDNCIIAFSSSGDALHFNYPGYAPILTCCDLYGNADGDWSGPIEDQYGVNGNISEDPLFCDADAYRLYLASGSPCLDEGGCGIIGAHGLGCSFDLISVADVEDDQGGFVDVTWYQIGYDSAASDTVVDFYSVWRRVDEPEAGGAPVPPAYMLHVLTDPPGEWECVDSVAASGQETYTRTCTTGCDSTEAGICWSVFFVKAHCSGPPLEFDTEPDSGYSVDNTPLEAWTDVTTGTLGDTGFGHGFAWVDYDDDDDLDIFVANRTSENKLYRNDSLTAEGFVDATPAVLADPGDCRGAAWGDYDDDGDLDLYVSKSGANRLFRNDGSGVFVDVTASPLDDSAIGQTVSWADYDNDGDLDLYLVNNGPNKLFRNDGIGTFTEVTGGPIADGHFGLGCGWADYDNDGDLDLYIANYDAANVLLENQGSDVFVDVTTPVLGITTPSAGVAWGDYDNDGDLDLYVANDGANNLLRNDGGSFTDVTASPLDDANDARSAAWGDYNNDGSLDLYVVNRDRANRLFRNEGGGNFVIPDCATSAVSDKGTGVSAAWGDYDRDGDLDVFVTNDGSNKLFRNELCLNHHWLEIALTGVVSNTSGQGARVRLVAGGMVQMREIAGASGYLSQGPLTAWFGLGQECTVDTIEVTWPTGAHQILTGVTCDQSLEIIEDDLSGTIDKAAVPSAFRLYPNKPNPFDAVTAIRYDLPERTQVDLAVYDVSGRLVCKLKDGGLEEPGRHTAYWNGRNAKGRHVAPGVYFCEFSAGSYAEIQRMVLLK